MVVFRRYIDIENPRLDALSWTVWTTFFGGFAFLAYWSESWKRRFSVSNNVWLRTFSDDTSSKNFAGLMQTFEAGMNTPICQDPSQYDFWFDEAGVRKLADFTCATLCQRHELRRNCLSRHQVVQFPEYAQADFVTYVEDRTFETNGTSASVIRRLLPWAGNSMSLGLKYGLEVRQKSWINMWRRTKGIEQYTSDKDILTVILNADGKVVKHFKPNSHSLSFVLQDMLDWSQDSGRLDLDDPTHGSNVHNHKSGVFPTGPTPRLSGGNLHVRLQCYNFMPHTIHIDWNGEVVCTMEFQFESKLPHSSQLVAPIDGNGHSAERSQRAISVIIQIAGEFHVGSIVAIVFLIVQCLLLVPIPRALTWFITSRCLGKYSEIYRKAVVHDLDIVQECKGCAARTMCHNICYALLQESETTIRITGGLHKDIIAKVVSQTIAAKLKSDAPTAKEEFISREEESVRQEKKMTAEVLRRKEIVHKTKQELVEENEKIFNRKAVQAKGILDFCYQALVEKKHGGNTSLSEELHKIWRPRPIDDLDDPPDGVTMSQFVNACASEDLVSLRDLAMLFDGERPLGILENFFGNRQVRAYQEFAKNNLASDSESVTCYFSQNVGEHPTAAQIKAEALRQTPHSRMDRVLYRLKEIEEMLKSGAHDVKPPTVVQLPAILRLDKGIEKVFINVKFDKVRGAHLGLQLKELYDHETGTERACITGIDAEGLAQAWNDEQDDRDKLIEILDCIIAVNDVDGSFARIQEELSIDGIIEMKVEKTHKKVHKDTTLNTGDNDSDDPSPIEDRIADLERRRIDAQVGIESSRAEITKLSKVRDDAELLRNNLRTALTELQVLFSRKPYEISIISNIVIGKPFCQRCGTEDNNLNIPRCHHCGRKFENLPKNCDLVIPDPAEGTYDLLVNDVLVTGVHYDRIRKPSKDHLMQIQIGDRVIVRGAGSHQGMSLFGQNPDFADWTDGVVTAVSPIAVQPDGWQFSYFFEDVAPVATHEEAEVEKTSPRGITFYEKGEIVEYLKVDTEGHAGNWVMAKVESENEISSAGATTFILRTKEQPKATPELDESSIESQSRRQSSEPEPTTRYGEFESRYYSIIPLRLPSPGMPHRRPSKKASISS